MAEKQPDQILLEKHKDLKKNKMPAFKDRKNLREVHDIQEVLMSKIKDLTTLPFKKFESENVVLKLNDKIQGLEPETEQTMNQMFHFVDEHQRKVELRSSLTNQIGEIKLK